MTSPAGARQILSGNNGADMPEFSNITTNDWFAIKDQHSEFRILRDDDLSSGYEEFYVVRPGFYIRFYSCIESVTLHDRVEVPRGLFHCLFNLRGNTELQIRGRGRRALVSPSLYVCYFPADLVLIDSPVLHDQERLFVHLIIDPEDFNLESIGAGLEDLSASVQRILSGQGQFSFRSFPLHGQLLYLVNQAAENAFRGGLKAVYVRAKAIELICYVFDGMSNRDIEASRPGPEAIDMARIDEVRSYVEDNIVDAPTLSELARRFGMSPSKLKRDFKATLGVSIGSYRQALRMYKARDMLRHSMLSVNQVALESGYDHTSSFITAFKRSFGTTPKSYQSLLKRT